MIKGYDSLAAALPVESSIVAGPLQEWEGRSGSGTGR